MGGDHSSFGFLTSPLESLRTFVLLKGRRRAYDPILHNPALYTKGLESRRIGNCLMAVFDRGRPPEANILVPEPSWVRWIEGLEHGFLCGKREKRSRVRMNLHR